MSRLRKLLLLLLIFAPVLFCGYKIGFYGFQLYLNRTPAEMADVPTYPGARNVRHTPCANHSLVNCSTLAYHVDAGEADIYRFYDDYVRGESFLPQRSWTGDGTAYPEHRIVNHYHKAQGRFQVLRLSTLANPAGVEVTVVLTDKPPNW